MTLMTPPPANVPDPMSPSTFNLYSFPFMQWLKTHGTELGVFNTELGVFNTELDAVIAGLSGANLEIFTTSQTWTKPVDRNRYIVILIGGGGGGGSGRRGAASTARSGGSGAGGAGISIMELHSSQIAATATITIGAGGIGGAAITVNSTNGNSGAIGGDTTFYSEFPSQTIIAKGGNFGLGGTNTAVAGGAGSYRLDVTYGWSTIPNAGAASSTTTAPSQAANAPMSPSGGGAGASISSGNALLTASSRGNITSLQVANAYSAATSLLHMGTTIGAGGDGGAASSTAAATAGQAGNNYGGGGGGGGASLDGFNSGKGGDGAPGVCAIISY